LEWEKACMDNGLRPWKLKTPIKTRFTSKVIMFEETLELKVVILLNYGRQKTLSLQQLPKAQVWAITKIDTMSLNPMVTACVLNQSRGH
jgi:hypothetical protein